MSFREWRTTLEDVVEVGRERDVTTIAAELAFHALNTFVPAVILLVVGLSASDSLGSLAPFVGRLFGVDPGALGGIARRMTSASGRLRAGVVAGVILLWSAGALFGAMQDSFAEVYGSEPYDSWTRKLLGIALTVATFAAGFVVMGVLGVWLSNFVEGLAWQLASPFLLVLALAVLFVPFYYVLPNVSLELREALPGAAFAALGWTLSAVGFRLYASISSSVQLYGALGGLVLFTTWVYLGGLLLVLGVVVNAVVADRLDVAENH